MPVIICKNDKLLITLYNVICSHMTGTFELYLLLKQCATEMKSIGKPICLIKLIHKHHGPR